VYRAEDSIRQVGKKFTTIPEIEAYINKVRGSAWFKRRWPDVASSRLRLKDGRGTRIAGGGYSRRTHTTTLNFPVWSRVEAVVLHELAHACTYEQYGYGNHAPHGWEFAATLLELVTHELGAESGQNLREAYKAKKVRFHAPRTRTLTTEQREAARERLAYARAAKYQSPRLAFEKVDEDIDHPWREEQLGVSYHIERTDTHEVVLDRRIQTEVWPDGSKVYYSIAHGITDARSAARAWLKINAQNDPGVIFRATFEGRRGNVEVWQGTWVDSTDRKEP
jgi:putative metallohydrolase (TIGR04338 family)